MLTARQKQGLDFIKQFISNRSYAPSYREICEAMGYSDSSTNAVTDLLKSLKVKGMVDWQPAKARTLVVTSVGWQYE